MSVRTGRDDVEEVNFIEFGKSPECLSGLVYIKPDGICITVSSG